MGFWDEDLAEIAESEPAPQAQPKARPRGGDFTSSVYSEALDIYGDPEEALIATAQAALETGYGKSVPGGNLFGIKSHGRPGGGSYSTTEVVNGRPVRTSASFRGYGSSGESIADRGHFLQTNSRYGKAGYFDAADAESKADALQRAGYATDPQYSAKLKSIISQLREQGLGYAGESLTGPPRSTLLPPEEEHDAEDIDAIEEKWLSGISAPKEGGAGGEGEGEGEEGHGFLSGVARGAGERAAALGGGVLEFASDLGKNLEEAVPLGGFTWEGWMPEYRSPSEYAAYMADKKDWLQQGADVAKAVDLGYDPMTTWEDVKDSEGVGSFLGNLAGFGFEQFFTSTPDMVAAVVNLPAYALARTGELSQSRAEADGKEDPDFGDMVVGGLAAVTSAYAEKFGVERLIKALKGKTVDIPEAQRGFIEFIKTVGKRTAQTGGIEALTEAIQEAAEYTAVHAGTEKGFDTAELVDSMLAGAAGGAVPGGAIGAVGGVRERLRTPKEGEAEAEAEGEAEGEVPASQVEPTIPETVGDEGAAITAVLKGNKRAALVTRDEAVSAAQDAGLEALDVPNGTLIVKPEDVDWATELEEAGKRNEILGIPESKEEVAEEVAKTGEEPVVARAVDEEGNSPTTILSSQKNVKKAVEAAAEQAGPEGTVEIDTPEGEVARRVEAEAALPPAVTEQPVGEEPALTEEIGRTVQVPVPSPQARELVLEQPEPPKDVKASPQARKMAGANGLSVVDIAPTGKNGAVTVGDVRKAIAARTARREEDRAKSIRARAAATKTHRRKAKAAGQLSMKLGAPQAAPIEQVSKGLGLQLDAIEQRKAEDKIKADRKRANPYLNTDRVQDLQTLGTIGKQLAEIVANSDIPQKKALVARLNSANRAAANLSETTRETAEVLPSSLRARAAQAEGDYGDINAAYAESAGGDFVDQRAGPQAIESEIRGRDSGTQEVRKRLDEIEQQYRAIAKELGVPLGGQRRRSTVEVQAEAQREVRGKLTPHQILLQKKDMAARQRLAEVEEGGATPAAEKKTLSEEELAQYQRKPQAAGVVVKSRAEAAKEARKRRKQQAAKPVEPAPPAVPRDTARVSAPPLPPAGGVKQLPNILAIGVDQRTLDALKPLGGTEMRGDVKSKTFPPNTAVVSPANGFGWMDGGIDGEYREMFGQQLERRVQREMNKRYGTDSSGEGKNPMPLGDAFVIRTQPEGTPIQAGRPEWLIVAPTMTKPGRRVDGRFMRPQATPDVAGNAMQAALEIASVKGIDNVAVPGMGMGTAGGVNINTFKKAFGDAYDKADDRMFGTQTAKPAQQDAIIENARTLASRVSESEVLPEAGRQDILDARDAAADQFAILTEELGVSNADQIMGELRNELNPNDPYRVLLDALHSKGLGDVEVAVLPDAELRAEMQDPYAQAGFISSTNLETGQPARYILISESQADTREGLKSLIHELTHAAVNEGLRTDNALGMEMERLRKLAVRHLGAYDPDTNTGHYGLFNVDEFVAEALTNPEFQQALAGVKSRGRGKLKNIWEQFVGAVRNFLGVPVEANSVLSQVLAAAPDLMLSSEQSLARLADRSAGGYISAQVQPSTADAQQWMHGRRSASRVPNADKLRARGVSDKTLNAAGEWIDRVAPRTADFVRERRGYLGLMTMDQIVREFSRVVGAGLGRYNRANQRRTSIARREHIRAEEVNRAWVTWERRVGADKAKLMGKLMQESTLAGVDPSKRLVRRPKGSKTKFAEKQRQWNALNAQYRALGRDGQKIYRDVRDYYTRQRSSTRRALTRRALAFKLPKPGVRDIQKRLLDALDNDQPFSTKEIDAAFDAEVAKLDAEKDGDLIDVLRQVQEAVKEVAKITGAKAPYFPLKRWGDYVVSGKREGPDGAEEPWVSFHDTSAAARAQMEILKKQGWELDTKEPSLKRDWSQAGIQAAPQLLSQLKTQFKGDDAVAAQLEAAMVQLMAENNIRKSELERKGVAGASIDMRRAFAERAFAGSWALADVETAFDRADAIKEMYADAQGNTEAGSIVREVQAREARALQERKINGIDRVLAKFGFLNFLLSPSYAMVNATQVPLVTAPYLMAKYGKGSTKALFDAYAAVTGTAAQHVKKYYSGNKNPFKAAPPPDTVWKDMMEKLSPDEQKMIQELQNMGIIDATFAQELYMTSRGKSSVADSGGGTLEKLDRGTDALSNFGRAMPQIVETLNRVVTAKAAYSLAKGTHEQKVKAAENAVYETQFDYSDANKPRWFKPGFPGGRALLMFKMYSQGIYALTLPPLVRTLKGKGRKGDMKLFGGIVASHTLVAGVLGGVFAEPVMVMQAMINAALDEEDELDVETAVPNLMADLLGEQVGEIVSRGVPRAVGADLSGRVGLNNLIFMGLGEEARNAEEWYQKMVLQLLGPVGGAGLSYFKAIDSLSKGDVVKAITQAAPKLVRDPVKAWTQQTEGLKDRRGVPFADPDQFNFWDAIQQTVGFAPAETSRAWERRIAGMKGRNRYVQARDRLRDRWLNADPTERTAILRDEIIPFNRRNPHFALQIKNLHQSLQARQRRIAQQHKGYYIDPKQRAWLTEQVRF